MNFSAFDYSLLAMTLGILVVEALRSRSPKYKRALSVSLFMCSLVSFILTYRTSGASTSENFRALVASSYGIPIMLAIAGGIALLPHREDGKVIPAVSALQFAPLLSFLLMIVWAIGGGFSNVLFNMANACFVGFSPERFAWWRYARFTGLIVQVVAALCVVLVAAARMLPEDFLAMMNNKGKSAVVFAVSLLVLVLGISFVAMI